MEKDHSTRGPGEREGLLGAGPARFGARLSLALRLTISGTALLTLTAASVAYLGSKTTAEFLASRYQDHIRVLAEYTAMQTELGILLKDTEMIESAISALPERADLTEIAVYDVDGRLLALHVRSPARQTAASSFVEVPVWSHEVQETPPGIETESKQRRIGTVRLGYDPGVLEELVRRLALRFAAFTLGVTLLSAFIYGWIARGLTRPLRRLEAAARKVALGRLDVRAPEGGMRETHETARTFNAMLDALVKREKDLERLNARLARREALAEVGRFSSMVAHEIKNPLTILRGSLQVLRRPDPDATAHATALRFMDEELRRIDRLVEDFLLFAKPVTPERRPGDWAKWLGTATEKMRLMAEGGERLSLQVSDNEPVYGRFDPVLMETALGHLVRNALEVTASGGSVRILSWKEEAQAKGGFAGGEVPQEAKPLPACEHQTWWCFAVEDDGPGVPPEQQEKIFEPFFTTKAKGSGLGLAMVRRVIEAHGGTVTWQPGPKGRGSRFVVRLPALAH